MRITLLSALSVSALGISLAAQVPPAITRVDTSVSPWEPPLEPSLDPTLYLDPTGAITLGSATTAAQWEFPNFPALGGAGWRPMACTILNTTSTAAAACGIPAGGGVVAGEWNSTTGVVKLNNYAGGLNASAGGTEFALSISNDGLTAVCDQALSTGSGYAVRAATNVAFGSTSTVTGQVNYPPGGYGDSKLVQIGAQLHVAWIDTITNNLVSGRLVGPAISGAISTRVTSVAGTLGMHSPAPITNSGQVEAWICSAQVVAGASDPFCVPDRTSDLNPAVKIYADPAAGWWNNPGALGNSATTFWAHFGAYKAPKRLDMVMCNGGRLVPGQTKVVRVWHRQEANGWLVALMLGATAIAPLNLNFTWGNNINGPPRPAGQIGLLPVPTVPSVGTLGNSGGGNFGFIVPAGLPVGVPIYVQGVGVDVAAGAGAKPYLANTAVLQR